MLTFDLKKRFGFRYRNKGIRPAAFAVIVAIFAGCAPEPEVPSAPVITRLAEVPSVRLNFRYEGDVPPPSDTQAEKNTERNAAVQDDFDRNRPHEQLERTLLSPDGKRVLAVYSRLGDQPAEFRLDMYSAEGQLLTIVTGDSMAVHFPDTIRWSPDSANLAFVAMTRAAAQPQAMQTPAEAPPATTPSETEPANANAETPDPEANADSGLPTAPTPAPAANVLTFRTEQIYICNSDGGGLRPVTQNEGLIYFYYVWAPDSSMLAALAATSREWQFLEFKANENSEQFVPIGRPRVIEKNGRERRLDDGLTAVHPVWSPDSAKVACAFDKQVRIYDAAGDSPTQAAIPLRNYLLLSSQAYDRAQQAELNAANEATPAADQTNSANANTNPAALTLPDEASLVSFNPIILLNWPSDDLLYFQTAYLKRMKNEADSVMSFPRWHRLILTPQASLFTR
ncbi:MAG: hypothetical protein IPM25_10725 [Chloracidobacterium sp.]|nr:hypothetical protein [Chloracidobacterium sp.]